MSFDSGRIFVFGISSYGSCARDTFGCAGCLKSRSANLRTAVTHLLGREWWQRLNFRSGK